MLRIGSTAAVATGQYLPASFDRPAQQSTGLQYLFVQAQCRGAQHFAAGQQSDANTGCRMFGDTRKLIRVCPLALGSFTH